MYIVKNDNPDVGFQTSFSVTDMEGETVPASELDVKTTSDNEASVSVIADPGGDPLKGTIHFGTSGTANLNVSVSKKDGTLLGSFGAQFTVTTGEVSAISSGTIKFSGLSES